MKPAGPAEPTLSIPTLLMESSSGDAVVCTIKQRCFSYADMLPVKVLMSNTLQHCYKIPSLGKNQHKNITTTIGKTEFRGEHLFENNSV